MSRFTLILFILFAVFIGSPALFSVQFGPYPLMKTGDVIDIFTPLILIPLCWTLFQVSQEKRPSPGERLVFVVLATLWVAGQGTHLTANSIGHLLKEMKGNDVHTLASYYDEVLRHHLWHSA